MKLKQFFAGMSAAAVAVGSIGAASVSADAEPEIYGRAGIVWMIMDQWDHKNSMDLEPFDEMETTVLSCTHTDVNITGNGQYEVALEGYHPPTEVDYMAGNLGVELDLDFAGYEDLTVTFDEAVIDGVSYTFNEQPELEEFDGEGTYDSVSVMKIKNPYGVMADTTPEMTNYAWKTTDPLTVKFTVSGLPTDKIEGYENEQVVTEYGNGSIDNDVADEPESEAGPPEEQKSSEEPEQKESASSDSASSEEKEESDSKLPLYIGIGAGAAVIIAVIAVVAVKKKK